MNVLGRISLPVTKHGVSPTIRPPNDRVQSDWAKLSKTKETAISKIVSEEDVNCFFSYAECVIHREFVPEVQKVNAEF